ncbi:unnamed protein product [Bursaphelenchus okinawaensis]|uniref:Cullin family profile domain-containing protein n=1 Tax=Bursaphelenchus okinawaensis TaxID=465554 RepID=A0A811KKC2_9BILA|nr:unnamed protein product [Bursaphelenchus okinawaensis]CAG9105472.1 unnamed protein product [Bursaphelenchus okinawaensis]
MICCFQLIGKLMEVDQDIVPCSNMTKKDHIESVANSYTTMAHKKIVHFDEYWGRLQLVVSNVMETRPLDQTAWNNSFFDIYELCVGQYSIDLYGKLIDFFKNRVQAISQDLSGLKGLDLLHAYSTYWYRYDLGAGYVNQLCRYLNRTMLKDTNVRTFKRKFAELEEDMEGNNFQIQNTARRLWRKELILPLKDRLYEVIWSVFIQTRDVSYVTYPTLDVIKVLDSYISVCFASDHERRTMLASFDPNLCVRPNYPSPPQLNFYVEIFEDRFLQDNRAYFREMLATKLVHYNMYDYMTKIIKILENEDILASNMLFIQTVKKLLVLLRKIFILEQLPRFDEVVPEYVKLEKKAELRLTYILLDYFPDAAQILVNEYEKQVAASLENHLGGLFLNPSVFTEAACAKHAFYTKFNKEVFSDAVYIQHALRRAIESVVNKEREGEKFYAAKMLSRHMDLLLKRSSKHKAIDIDTKLDEAVTIFRYIRDKDTFHKIFQRMFAIRLLNKLSVSMELEQMMIEKLRDTCGHEYAGKLSRMYQDCQKSRQLNLTYHEDTEFHCDPYNRENEFTVIQTCAWPVICSNEDPALKNINIPQSLKAYAESIEKFYEKQHAGRILKFAYHVSTADVVIRLGSKRCTVTMTVPQAMILLEFETRDVMTIKELIEVTQISFEYVCSSLKALIDFKVLKVKEKQGCYTEETPVHLNSGFEALRARVHLQPPTIVSKANENNPMPSNRETQQDRKVAVECAIVRAMKTRKAMKHQDLVDWVVTSIADRFVPDRPFLKQCIEGLIEKHYLQRTDNVDEYEYLP